MQTYPHLFTVTLVKNPRKNLPYMWNYIKREALEITLCERLGAQAFYNVTEKVAQRRRKHIQEDSAERERDVTGTSEKNRAKEATSTPTGNSRMQIGDCE